VLRRPYRQVDLVYPKQPERHSASTCLADDFRSTLATSRTSRRSAAVDSVTLRMFTGLTSRNCPIKSQIRVCPH
jgi:hypothetical protein